MNGIEPSPGYSETDIEMFIKDPRVVAAVHAYAHDRLTIGQVMAIARPSPQEVLLPRWFKSHVLAYARMINEVARRIFAGQIQMTDRAWQEYAELQSQFGSETPSNLAAYKFSELEGMAPELNPYTARRESFNETDIEELIKVPRVLACLDAYCQGITSFAEAKRRMFGNERYFPRALSHPALLHLAFEVCERIKSGRIAVPTSFRNDFSFAYVPEPKSR